MRVNLMACMLTVLTLMFVRDVNAKYITKPPSIALRTEVSYVCVVELKNIISRNDKISVMNFELIRDLHNKSKKNISINISRELAQQLQKHQRYIIAYTNVKQVKIEGIKKYIPLKDGSILINEQGAEPAIFNYNKLLEKQLTSSPKLSPANQKVLLKTIFKGMENTDPKIKEFFVREIINWKNLNEQLTKLQLEKLKKAFISTDNSVGIMIGVLENRTELHKRIGNKFLGKKVLSLLKEVPVKLDVNGQVPNLILNALYFADIHSVASFEIYKRWSRSNVPPIVEKALLAMKKINPKKMVEFVHNSKNETLLSPSTRRVFQRLDTPLKSYAR